MAAVITQRQNFTPTGEIEIIDGIEFEGFGTSEFAAKDLLILGDDEDDIIGSGHDKIEGGGGDEIIKTCIFKCLVVYYEPRLGL